MTEGRYGTSGSARIYDWLERTKDPSRREALIAWTAVVTRDPYEAHHAVIARGPRRLYVAHVPVARTCVTYSVWETPARVVHVVQISDDDYDRDTAETEGGVP